MSWSCREIVIEYSKNVMELGLTLFEILSEALGLVVVDVLFDLSKSNMNDVSLLHL